MIWISFFKPLFFRFRKSDLEGSLSFRYSFAQRRLDELFTELKETISVLVGLIFVSNIVDGVAFHNHSRYFKVYPEVIGVLWWASF
jgi:hypothetical protein